MHAAVGIDACGACRSRICFWRAYVALIGYQLTVEVGRRYVVAVDER